MSNDVVDMVRSDEDIILIDVRTPQEYRERRIPGSILLPDYEIRDRAADVIPDKDADRGLLQKRQKKRPGCKGS